MEKFSLRIKNLIKTLSSTLQMVGIYTIQHPRARTAVDELYEEFVNIFERVDELHFGVVGDEIFSGSQIYFDLTSQVKDFINVLKEKELEFIRFKKGLTSQEIADFLAELSVRKKEDSPDFSETLLKDKRFTHIQVGKFGQKVEESEVIKDESLKRKLFHIHSSYQRHLNSISSILEQGIDANQLDRSSLVTTATHLLNLSIHHQNALSILSGVKKHDDYTFVHCVNTAILTMFQARILGLADKDIVELGVAAFLHDIGKIAIKRTLIDKKGKLSDEEFSTIKNHTIYGTKILLKSPGAEKLSLIVNFQHHIGFNLGGYPKTKFLKKQNLASKLISISDVYDALRSRRSYRESMSLERVYEIMKKEEGRLFDPHLLQLFFRNLGVWPVGTLVMLDTQEVGLVKNNNPQDIFRPKVEIYFDRQGNKMDESFIADLTEKDENGDFKRKILRHLYSGGEGKKYISELFGEI